MTADKVLEGRFPERVLEKAVERMIPRGPLGGPRCALCISTPAPSIRTGGTQPQPLDVAAMNRKNKVGA